MLEEKEEEEDEGAKPSPAPSQPLASLLAAIHEEASNQSTIPLDDGAPTSTTRSSSPRSSRSGRRGKQRHISSSPSHSTPPRPTRTSPRISSRTRSTTSTATTPLPPSSNTSTFPSSTSSTPSLPAHQQQHMPRQAQDYQSPATQTTIAATGTVGAATTALPRATPPEVVVAAMVQNLAGTHVTFPPNSDWATVNTLAGSIAGLAERAGQGHIGPNEVAALQQGATLLQLVMGGVQPAWFYPAPPQLPPQQTSAPSAAPLPPPPASATVAPPGPILTPLQHPPPPRQPAPLPAQSLAAAPPQQTTLPPLRSLFLPAPPPPQQPQGRTDQVRSGEDTPARRPHGK